MKYESFVIYQHQERVHLGKDKLEEEKYSDKPSQNLRRGRDPVMLSSFGLAHAATGEAPQPIPEVDPCSDSDGPSVNRRFCR